MFEKNSIPIATTLADHLQKNFQKGLFSKKSLANPGE